MVFVDVGAHVGYFSLIGAVQVGPTGTVLSYEPDPEVFRYLQRNVAPYPWVHAQRLAIADRVGYLTFYRTPRQQESGWGSLFNGGEGRSAIQVATSTLDEQVIAHHLQRIDLVKVDVEGAEVRVLEGTRTLLKRYRPIWVLEINAPCLARDGRRPEDVHRLLQEADYRLLYMNENTLIAFPD